MKSKKEIIKHKINLITMPNETLRVLDYHRDRMSRKHPEMVNMRSGKVSYSAVVRKALIKSGMWDKATVKE